eukprot:gene5314-6777_t
MRDLRRHLASEPELVFTAGNHFSKCKSDSLARLRVVAGSPLREIELWWTRVKQILSIALLPTRDSDSEQTPNIDRYLCLTSNAEERIRGREKQKGKVVEVAPVEDDRLVGVGVEGCREEDEARSRTVWLTWFLVSLCNVSPVLGNKLLLCVPE